MEIGSCDYGIEIEHDMLPANWDTRKAGGVI